MGKLIIVSVIFLVFSFLSSSSAYAVVNVEAQGVFDWASLDYSGDIDITKRESSIIANHGLSPSITTSNWDDISSFEQIGSLVRIGSADSSSLFSSTTASSSGEAIWPFDSYPGATRTPTQSTARKLYFTALSDTTFRASGDYYLKTVVDKDLSDEFAEAQTTFHFGVANSSRYTGDGGFTYAGALESQDVHGTKSVELFFNEGDSGWFNVEIETDVLALGRPIVTPEPTSMALFGLGAGALGLAARRRKKYISKTSS